MSAEFSAKFLMAVAAEIGRCERAIDRLDRRIEKARRQATKDALSAERERWEAYERQLRETLR